MDYIQKSRIIKDYKVAKIYKALLTGVITIERDKEVINSETLQELFTIYGIRDNVLLTKPNYCFGTDDLYVIISLPYVEITHKVGYVDYAFTIFKNIELLGI